MADHPNEEFDEVQAVDHLHRQYQELRQQLGGIIVGLEDVIDRLTFATWDAPTANSYEAAVRRAEERVLVDRLMWLAASSPNGQVRAIASYKLSKLATRAVAKLSNWSG